MQQRCGWYWKVHPVIIASAEILCLIRKLSQSEVHTKIGDRKLKPTQVLYIAVKNLSSTHILMTSCVMAITFFKLTQAYNYSTLSKPIILSLKLTIRQKTCKNFLHTRKLQLFLRSKTALGITHHIPDQLHVTLILIIINFSFY